MEENILIFRSAQNFIVKKLIDSLDSKKSNIFLVIQENESKYFKENDYENIKYIEVDNDFFCYKNLRRNKNIKKIINEEFGKIIIPSSLEQFEGYEEIEKLILRLKYKEVIFFNKLGETEIINISSFQLFLKAIEKKYNAIFYLKYMCYSIIKILRRIFLVRYNNVVMIHILAIKAIGGSERRFLRAISYICENNMINDMEIYVVLQGNKNYADILIDKFCSFKEIKFIYTKDNYDTLKKVKKYKPKIFHMTEFLEKEYKMFILMKKLVKNFLISITDTNKLYYNEYLNRPIFKKMLKLVEGIDCLYPSKVPILKEICCNQNYITPTINSFIDLLKFKPSKDKRNTIIFAARMQNFKNPMLALEAINLAKNLIRKYHYKCLFLGEGPEIEKLSVLINRYKLDDLIELKGYVDTTEYFQESRIFLSLQQVENYPSQSLMEAIACGNYIIASNVGDTEVILADSFSSLVELNEEFLAEEIAKTIIKLNDKEFSENVVNSAYNFAQNNFKIESFCQYLCKFWDEF
ncbi:MULTISPECIES: glycosyltransferase [unclassified Clostridium]|uniref:glycosyltransferase n=1 Tax=unclassified Clostridium TaxID=2614128 RepID=UPI000298359D|nr:MULTISPECIES: glycosyltransferase [unclassified Clostridium]EKQ51108.1 MAG: glycosyltransferase [Clostridium sp. Maddingley MBC34-26]